MRPRPSDLVRAACQATGAEPDEVLAYGSTTAAAETARQLIAAYCRHCCTWHSSEAVARILGRSAHTVANGYAAKFDRLPVMQQVELLEDIHGRLHPR